MSDNDLPPEDETDAGEESNQDDQALADEWAAAMSESGDDERDDNDDAQSDPTRAPLEEFGAATSVGSPGDSPNLDVILDIPVVISMEVGNTQIPIRNLLQLNQGSVIELDRLAGEPLDVLVNGTLIAHGEVVMVNEKFGIRLTDVVSQQERIQRLR
ncbi:flagellar motor switch protein FliN [Saccharospirillum alexandrii]|uniref:flagellar motor switch protein FliN n=1 Tax=Saccharospirillum alexandrii TaxID=2448477 RepID=UPI000FDAF6DC|nr:flagellar motor switch protein FliN [Saccharospirillum alexandrii]